MEGSDSFVYMTNTRLRNLEKDAKFAMKILKTRKPCPLSECKGIMKKKFKNQVSFDVTVYEDDGALFIHSETMRYLSTTTKTMAGRDLILLLTDWLTLQEADNAFLDPMTD